MLIFPAGSVNKSALKIKSDIKGQHAGNNIILRKQAGSFN